MASPSPTPSPSDAALRAKEPAVSAGRLLSLDALRGFDMFWIMGSDALGNAIGALGGLGFTRIIADQLEHKEWAGFHFEDLIFPLFVFLAGVSQAISLTRLREREGIGPALVRLLRRTVLLYVLGIFYYGGFSGSLDNIRLLGVLQRIALASGGAGTLFLLVRTRGLIAITAAILLGYWALLSWTPVRDISLEKKQIAAQMTANPGSTVRTLFDATTQYVRGSYEEGKNVVNHFDFQYLPGRKWDGHFDPEGILSTIPAVASGLLGILAGIFLRNPGWTGTQKSVGLVVSGVALLALGWAWAPWFPVIKKLWTSSFVLVAGGWSSILLGSFHWLIDVRGWKRWCTPFVWVGMNSITVYLAGAILDFDQLAARFVGGDIKKFLNENAGVGIGTLVQAMVSLALVLILARFLHRRQIFLRV